MTRRGMYHPVRTGRDICTYMYFWHNYSNLCWKLHVLINNFYSAAWNFFLFVFPHLQFIRLFILHILFNFYMPIHSHLQPIFLIHSISPSIFPPLHPLCSPVRRLWQHGLHVAPPLVLACDGGTVVFSSSPSPLTDADQTGACPH